MLRMILWRKKMHLVRIIYTFKVFFICSHSCRTHILCSHFLSKYNDLMNLEFKRYIYLKHSFLICSCIQSHTLRTSIFVFFTFEDVFLHVHTHDWYLYFDYRRLNVIYHTDCLFFSSVVLPIKSCIFYSLLKLPLRSVGMILMCDYNCTLLFDRRVCNRG